MCRSTTADPTHRSARHDLQLVIAGHDQHHADQRQDGKDRPGPFAEASTRPSRGSVRSAPDGRRRRARGRELRAASGGSPTCFGGRNDMWAEARRLHVLQRTNIAHVLFSIIVAGRNVEAKARMAMAGNATYRRLARHAKAAQNRATRQARRRARGGLARPCAHPRSGSHRDTSGSLLRRGAVIRHRSRARPASRSLGRRRAGPIAQVTRPTPTTQVSCRRRPG